MLYSLLIDDYQLEQHQCDPRWNGSFRGSSEQFNKQELFSVQKPGLQVTWDVSEIMNINRFADFDRFDNDRFGIWNLVW